MIENGSRPEGKLDRTGGKPMDSTDSFLVRRAGMGDKKAFEFLVEKYQHRIFNLIRSMVGSEEEAGDLTQDVFVRVFRKIGSFKGNSSFYTWLYRISVNMTLDHLRKYKRSVEYGSISLDSTVAVGEVEVIFSVGDSSEMGISGDMHIERLELKEAVWKALGMLSDEHRMVLLLHDMEGFKYMEIAEIMGCSVGTVKSRLHYAREHIRSMLKGYFESEV